LRANKMQVRFLDVLAKINTITIIVMMS
jgi:hypothetical protein